MSTVVEWIVWLFEIDSDRIWHVEAVRFSVWLFIWSIISIICDCAVARWSDSKRCFLNPSVKEGFRATAGSYITSLVHSLLVSFRGIDHIRRTLPLPMDVRIQPPLNVDSFDSEAWLGPLKTNRIFMAYLLIDMVRVIIAWPKLGQYDFIFHHLGFMSVSIVGATTISAPFQFGWLIVGEVSTIFLNSRWFLIKLGYGATPIMTAANILFALSFFIFRIVIYTFGVYELYYSSQYLTRPNLVGRCMLIGGILIGYVLNIFWFKKIALLGFSKNQKEKGKTT
ncbi:hypothetical protein NDN08_006509 [Rhodosorus marinus]|uniref:TLC domain-containing protein n=1 Tax=Rhodosorus marinus TaxID=101924 RepID=A0AAV8UKV7_9RHOD|nr:hypothetical protein NDN08_006509 [Rhodosorus marinus]